MNGNVELLNFVYQNSSMGSYSLEKVIDVVEDENFRDNLEFQMGEYLKIAKEAKKLLNKNGCDEKGLTSLEKIKTYMMINMQTMSDKSTSHIAEMLIIGSNMGVIDAIKNIRRYEDAEPEILSLMKKLLKFEEQNVLKLKEYL